MHTINIQPNPSPKALPTGPLTFGTAFTDHMFRAVHEDGQWKNLSVEPFRSLDLSPGSAVLHYGQSIFEGLKAYLCEDQKVRLFRPDKNAERFKLSAERLCLPVLPDGLFVEGIEALIRQDRRWIPEPEGASLYIRPFMFAAEPFLGVRPAKRIEFLIIACPVAAYYASGFAPVKIWVETEEVRAAPGGVGFAKTGCNYAISLHAAEKAKAKGYTQVLWTDALTHNYLEEVGTMNMVVVLDDEIVTPPLDGSILPGVTRDSVLTLLRSQGKTVSERPISFQELLAAHEQNTLREVFGTGTAAVISPVGALGFEEGEITINGGQAGPVATALEAELTGIQRGIKPDPFGWTRVVEL